jgi:thymidylate synthase (FAD)
MKIITEPNVHVLAIPFFMPHPEYKLPPCTSGGLNLTAHAGKGCYDSYGEDGRSIEEHIKSLIKSKHGSVFEHANVSLFITGISRGLSHELVRHRHFAYSQRSTRYTNEDEASIVLDPFYSKLYKSSKIESEEVYNFIKACNESLMNYREAVKSLGKTGKNRKWKRGKARQLLPHALETRLTMTGNIRAWRWFIESRSSRHAEAEIRRLSNYVFYKLHELYPLLFEDYFEEDIDDFSEYTTTYSKI